MTTFGNADGTTAEIWDVSEHPQGADMDAAWLEALRHAPAWLTNGERLLLFTLIYCLRPRRYLEVGVLHGGSALIVVKALDAVNGEGKLVLVDPEPQIDDSHWRQIEHRSVLIRGESPTVLGQAEQMAGGSFDFVFIDANHETIPVMRDANGVLPYLADGAYILFHDGFRTAVSRAIDRFVIAHSGSIVDFGMLTREFTRKTDGPQSVQEKAGMARSCGFRLVQFRRRHGRSILLNAMLGLWFRCEDFLKWPYRKLRGSAAKGGDPAR